MRKGSRVQAQRGLLQGRPLDAGVGIRRELPLWSLWRGNTSLRTGLPEQPALQDRKRPGTDQPVAGTHRRRCQVEQAGGSAQESDHAVPLGPAAGTLFRLQLSDQPEVVVSLRVYFLSAVGGTRYSRTGEGRGRESESIRAPRRVADEHGGHGRAVGSSLWLGEY